MMPKPRSRHEAKGGLDLIDEAVHLLRLAPTAALATYYAGSLPFVLGLLYFWSDMSRSAFAEERGAPAALGVAVLFVWMKTWQSLFARRLLAQVAGEAPPPLGLRAALRAGLVQTVIQPSGLFVLPIALLITLPFGWVYAFYQNATVLACDAGRDTRELFRKALRQAQFWPGQNHALLAVLFAFGFFVFLNVALGAMTAPRLVKMLTGVELEFAKSWATVFNTTFLAAVTGATYLCLDPLLKAVYVLRCFYGQSLHTGADLKAELKGFLSQNKASATGLALLVFLAGLSPGAAITLSGESANLGFAWAAPVAPNESSAPKSGQRGLSSAELDRSIERVINQREYSWRLPRERRSPGERESDGWLGAFLDGVVVTIKGWAKKLGQWFNDLIEWLARKLGGLLGGRRASERPGTDWLTLSRWLLFALLAIVASVLGVAFLRMWRNRRRRANEIPAVATPAIPDLTDENLVASELPEDDWLRLARELAGRGDLRSALRALFLASLAHLAQRNLITLVQSKSNREYERELFRRARSSPEVQDAFTQNVTLYDRVWYGLHEASPEMLEQFNGNIERIKTL